MPLVSEELTLDFLHLTIKQRLIAMIALMSVLLFGLGLYGVLNLRDSNASIKTVYEDRVVCLGQLDSVARSLLHAQWALALAVVDDRDRAVQADGIAESIRQADDIWTAYKATYLTEEETALSKRMEAAMEHFRREVYTPGILAVKSGDIDQTRTLALKSNALYAEIRQPLDLLVKLQLDVARSEYDHSQQVYAQSLWLSSAAIVLGLSVAVALGLWLIRSISAPLNRAVSVARSVAAGDLTQHIEKSTKDEVGQLLGALRSMNQGLYDIVSRVRNGSDLIATASGQIATGNLDLSARTEEQASSLEETASSLEELTSTVKQNAENARHASDMADQAAQEAEHGGREVQNVVQRMIEIRDSSTQIVDIIAVIDGIAFQTNILALNAAVEAARAGEQGRGFAVVATEVRNLAQRSAAAAREIKVLITDSVAQISDGSTLAQAAGSTIQSVVVSINKVRDLVSGISTASREQTVGIDQINQAVLQMDGVTQQNAALVEQAAAAARSLEEQAAELMKTVGVFKIQGGAQPHRRKGHAAPLPALVNGAG